jgi:hypothetical protein
MTERRSGEFILVVGEQDNGDIQGLNLLLHLPYLELLATQGSV